MKQIQIARILKIFTAAAAVIVSLFFFWYVPLVVEEFSYYSAVAWLKWPGLCGMWLIALLCYLALWQFWRICTRIGKDNSFCRENASAMKRIGFLAFGVGGLIVAGMIFLDCVNCLSGPLCVVSFFVICAACGIGVICMALSILIGNAAKLKEENDLTI